MFDIGICVWFSCMWCGVEELVIIFFSVGVRSRWLLLMTLLVCRFVVIVNVVFA